MSPETDILIVGYNEERFADPIRTAFRHWQVYSCANPFAIYDRQFRRAYVTGGAFMHKNWPAIYESLKVRGEVHDFAEYEEPTSPDPQDFTDAVLVSELRRARYPHS